MTMGYTLVYGLINFAILATALFFIGRKLVPKIFGGRRDQIVEDLKNADSAVENADVLLAGIEDANRAGEEECAGILNAARETAAGMETKARAATQKAAQEYYTDNEKAIQHETRTARRELTRESMDMVIAQAATLLGGARFADARKRFTEKVILRAEEGLEITRCELLGFREKGSLPVEFRSAEPLTEEQEQRLKAAVLGKLRETDPETVEEQLELVTSVDEDLIGGVYLRLGDTVYDSTLGACCCGRRSRSRAWSTTMRN